MLRNTAKSFQVTGGTSKQSEHSEGATEWEHIKTIGVGLNSCFGFWEYDQPKIDWGKHYDPTFETNQQRSCSNVERDWTEAYVLWPTELGWPRCHCAVVGLLQLKEDWAHARNVFHVLRTLWVEVAQLGNPEEKYFVISISSAQQKSSKFHRWFTFPTQFLVQPVEMERPQMSCPPFSSRPWIWKCKLLSHISEF